MTKKNAAGVDPSVDSDAVVEGGKLVISGLHFDNDATMITANKPTAKLEHNDIGLYATREISGTAWLDSNKDGIRQNGETLLEGVTVTLIDENGNPVESIKTDDKGYYEFKNVLPGTYKIVFSDGDKKVSNCSPAPKDQGSDDKKDSDASYIAEELCITGIKMPDDKEIITEGKENPFKSEYNDVGLYVSRELSGTAWIDSNRNGKRDKGEALLPGIKVTLVDTDGNPVKTIDGIPCETTTNSAGNYKFTDLPQGDFKVIFDIDVNKYALTTPHATDVDDTVDSDAKKVQNSAVIPDLQFQDDDATLLVSSASKAKLNHNDMGVYASRTLSGTAWLDSNKDGIRQSSEKLLANVKVALYDASGKIVVDFKGNKCETKTDSKGFYRFTDLPAGTFKVVFSDGDTKISGYDITKKDQGKDDKTDSDAAVIDNVICILNIVLPSDEDIILNGMDNPFNSQYHDVGFCEKSKSNTAANTNKTDSVDKNNTTTKNNVVKKVSQSNVPKTGDDFPILLWLLLMAVSGAGLVGGLYQFKKIS